MTHALRAAAAALSLFACAGALAGPLQVSVVDKDGKPVPDAVVVLAPAGGGAPKTGLPNRITINQEKMRFVPAVALVAVGTKALFTNNDPWEHHVRAGAAGLQEFTGTAQGGFELRLDGKAEGKAAATAEASFDKAGAVLLGCHLHQSMRGYVYVSESPWAVLTGADGMANFEGVPSGAVKVSVWQADQLVDLPPRTLTVSDAPAKAAMQLSVVPRRRRA